MGQLSQVWQWLAHWCCSISFNTVPCAQSQPITSQHRNIPSNQNHSQLKSRWVSWVKCDSDWLNGVAPSSPISLSAITTNHISQHRNIPSNQNHSQLKFRWVSWVKCDSDWINDVAPSSPKLLTVLNQSQHHNQSHHNITSNQITHHPSSNWSVESSVTVTGSMMLLHQL